MLQKDRLEQDCVFHVNCPLVLIMLLARLKDFKAGVKQQRRFMNDNGNDHLTNKREPSLIFNNRNGRYYIGKRYFLSITPLREDPKIRNVNDGGVNLLVAERVFIKITVEQHAQPIKKVTKVHEPVAVIEIKVSHD